MNGSKKKYSLFLTGVSAIITTNIITVTEKLNWEVFELDLKLVKNRMKKGVHSSK